jgi:endogenous inhibitor of DNA gyrase (YacG/DUF329 family)
MSRSAKQIKADKRHEKRKGLMEDSAIDDKSALWQVDNRGYLWADFDDKRILAHYNLPFLRDDKYYNPLDNRSMFFAFAELEPTEASFREFANKFGLLGIEPKTKLPDIWVECELLDDWIAAHTKMKNAVDLWNRINSGAVSSVVYSGKNTPEQECVNWIYHQPGDRQKVIRKASLDVHKPIPAAKRFLQQLINEGLNQRSRTCVLWNPELSEYVFRIFPRTLIGCMWWSFARTFTGELEFRRCPVCLRHMEIASGKHSKTAKFCSDACKQRDYRQRKTESQKRTSKKK